ncbi:DUF6497 family protein [Tropicimonas sp. TH_r6]|uniref:DUF6497 family protein n=1 Tax=Tropicimonas sp. TH_r6 TaxID=3082085 RepID=UPI0029550BB2|nr:DUF6497 family protein [Tropicimonas sp. TH_r6]MDV7145266.1 DUF6497 family protein [Tropicimonas sp. TH_r6]
MKWLGLVLALGAGAAQAEELVTPSGLEVEFLDRVVEEQMGGQVWLTLRYVSPRIGFDEGELGYDAVAADIDHLCDHEGLRAAAEAGGVDQVMIALMDRAVERGVHDPEATMFIGAYLPTDGGCVWQ